MHFAGDALSAGHAWIVGALNSGFRCVREVLEAEGRKDLVSLLEEKWGPLVSFATSYCTGCRIGWKTDPCSN